MPLRSSGALEKFAILREPLTGSLAAVKGNPFAVLKLYEPTNSRGLEDTAGESAHGCGFLDLPGELRNRIYRYYLFEDPADRARPRCEGDGEGHVRKIKNEAEQEQHAEPKRIYSKKVTRDLGNPFYPWRGRHLPPPALLAAHSQIHSEFSEILAEHGPYHIDLRFDMFANRSDSGLILETNLEDANPALGD